ncbi:MAG: cell division ATPase MinD [Candidatus Diapherotrites archaeon]
MGRSIALASGKGGVGKTTIVANLGIALASSGFKTLIVDADIAMANLSLLFKLQNSPITLHEVLMGDANIEDGIYSGPKGVEIVPSGLSLESYRKADPIRLKQAIESVVNRYDFVLLDVPAGIERCTLSAFNAAQQTLIITTPDAPSAADALKAKSVAQRLMSKPFGFVINMVRDEKGELTKTQLSTMLELPHYGSIPFDPEVRRSFVEGLEPVIVRKPQSPASKAIIDIASRLVGKHVDVEEKKGSIFARLFSMFSKKKEV